MTPFIVASYGYFVCGFMALTIAMYLLLEEAYPTVVVLPAYSFAYSGRKHRMPAVIRIDAWGYTLRIKVG